MSAGYQLVVSAGAGNTEAEAIRRARRSLEAAGPVEVVETGDPEALERALDATGDRVLVVAGGDGSLHLVLERLWRRGPDALAAPRLGLVPLGTGNDFARGIGLPLEPDAAAEAIVTGSPRRLDLIVDDAGGIVVNAAHVGVGAAAAEIASEIKDTLGALAYPVGALVAGLKEKGYQLDIELDGERIGQSGGSDGRVLMVGVANGPSIGGGAELCPPARPDDGRLDVVVVSSTGPLARTSFARDLQQGRHLDRDDVLHRQGDRVRVSGEPVRHNADGELTDELTDRTYTLRSDAWTLVCPPPSWGR